MYDCIMLGGAYCETIGAKSSEATEEEEGEEGNAINCWYSSSSAADKGMRPGVDLGVRYLDECVTLCKPMEEAHARE